jgi:hypothetical protein
MNKSTPSAARKLAGWAFGLAMTAAAGTAGAATLYQQSVGGNAWFANPNTPQQLADNFSLSSEATLERVTWWGGYASGVAPDDFRLRLYSNVTGQGTILHTFSVGAAGGTVIASGSFDTYQYDYVLPTGPGTTPVVLPGGNYYLFIENIGSGDWFWLADDASGGNSELWYRDADGDSWLSNAANSRDDLAFRLSGTPTTRVSEPDSLALLALASLGLAGWRSRRRRS